MKKHMSKADDYNYRQVTEGKIKPSHLTELGRCWQQSHGLDVDGFIGPNTIASLDLMGDGRPTMPTNRVWPLKLLADGRKPLVTSGYWTRNPARSQPDRRHYGVDIFYQRRENDPPMKIGDGGRTPQFWVPEGAMAVATAPGKVCGAAFVGNSRTGHRLWIDHGGGYYSGYFHLKSIVVTPGEIVAAGAELGPVGDNPIDGDARHLHFEVYWGDLLAYPRGSFDPELWLAGASAVTQ